MLQVANISFSGLIGMEFLKVSISGVKYCQLSSKVSQYPRGRFAHFSYHIFSFDYRNKKIVRLDVFNLLFFE
jgi:hypothetical protein